MNIFCEFIPQIIFLMSIFGYMNLLIIAKWLVFDYPRSGEAPSILITLINMFMFKYDEKGPLNLRSMYSGQQQLQTALVFLALICVPWMLAIKPYLMNRSYKRNQIQRLVEESIRQSTSRETSVHRNGSVPEEDGINKQSFEVESGEATTSAGEAGGQSHESHGHHDGGAFDLGDVIIHQVCLVCLNGARVKWKGESSTELQSCERLVTFSLPLTPYFACPSLYVCLLFFLFPFAVVQAIHTIEYCLGSISHTASYLRLWALSLAHAQLSEVLWNMVMRIGLTSASGFAGGIVMTVVFAFWAILTVGVLLLMEGLSAFLHALRLHWVEFQSKFYSGSGVLFDPFSFKVILENEEASVE